MHVPVSCANPCTSAASIVTAANCAGSRKMPRLSAARASRVVMNQHACLWYRLIGTQNLPGEENPKHLAGADPIKSRQQKVLTSDPRHAISEFPDLRSAAFYQNAVHTEPALTRPGCDLRGHGSVMTSGDKECTAAAHSMYCHHRSCCNLPLQAIAHWPVPWLQICIAPMGSLPWLPGLRISGPLRLGL